MQRRTAARAALLAALAVALVAGLVWRGAERAARAPEPAPAAASPPGAAAPPGAAPVRLGEPATLARDASGCAFSGRVVSAATGAGVPGAELTFSRSGEANAIGGAADGAFCFAPAQEGRWTLATVTAPGYLPFAPEWGHSPVLLDAREEARVHGVVVTLAPEVRYAGRVVDPSGRPVAGAEVRVLATGTADGAAMPLARRFTSDASGAFQLAAPDGSELEARHPSFDPGRARVDLAVRLARRVTIALAPPGQGPPDTLAIRGRVEDPDGQSAVGALVVASSRRTDRDSAARQATVDASGAFAVEGLPPGPWRVVASRAGLAPAVAEDVAAGAGDVALRLRAGGRLQGAVRDRAGALVTPFTLRVRWRGKDRFLAPRMLTVVDGAGRYDVGGLLPGPALVSASAPGRSPSAEVEVVIPEPGAPPASADLELAPPGRVFGEVVDAATQAPLAGAAVEVEGAEAAPSALRGKASARAGPDGRFELAAAASDAGVTLSVTAEGHHARVVPGLRVSAGGEHGPVQVALTPRAPGEEPRAEVAGLGAVLASAGDEALRVVSVAAGDGAAAAGLAPGDEVLAIEGMRVADVSLARAVNLMRAPENASVVLTVRRAADPRHAEERVVVERPGADARAAAPGK
jgi:carboxypeptidase family protein/PDZ domain-containing protein